MMYDDNLSMTALGRADMNKLFDEWLASDMDWTKSSLVIQQQDERSVNENMQYIWSPVYKLKAEMGELALGVINHKKALGPNWFRPSPDNPDEEDICQHLLIWF